MILLDFRDYLGFEVVISFKIEIFLFSRIYRLLVLDVGWFYSWFFGSIDFFRFSVYIGFSNIFIY